MDGRSLDEPTPTVDPFSVLLRNPTRRTRSDLLDAVRRERTRWWSVGRGAKIHRSPTRDARPGRGACRKRRPRETPPASSRATDPARRSIPSAWILSRAFFQSSGPVVALGTQKSPSRVFRVHAVGRDAPRSPKFRAPSRARCFLFDVSPPIACANS